MTETMRKIRECSSEDAAIAICGLLMREHRSLTEYASAAHGSEDDFEKIAEGLWVRLVGYFSAVQYHMVNNRCCHAFGVNIGLVIGFMHESSPVLPNTWDHLSLRVEGLKTLSAESKALDHAARRARIHASA